jgi:tetraacyldisaccharide 4'-kinase
MDDGFQNPSMYKDFSLIVVDAAACLGNGKVFPMGPLRAPFGFQARMADAIAVLGAERTGAVSKLRSLLADAGCQPSLFEAETVPSIDGERTAGKFLAFCGIGRPAKFFETLHRANVDVAAKRAFPDHHPYTEADAASLLAEAKSKRLRLITTEKDAARLKGMPGALEELYLSAVTLPISVSFSGRDEDRLMQALLPKLSRT